MELNSSVIVRRRIYSLMFVDQITLYLCLINEHLLTKNCIHACAYLRVPFLLPFFRNFFLIVLLN